MRTLMIVATVAAALASSQASAISPSFDCQRAEHADEFAICASETLTAGDLLTSTAFYQAKRQNRAVTISVTRNFLRRRRACGFSFTCILLEQADILETYRALGATVLD